MHGHPRRAPLERSVPHGNRQLDALGHSGGGAIRPATGAPARCGSLITGRGRAASTAIRLRIALQRVEQKHAQASAVPEKRRSAWASSTWCDRASAGCFNAGEPTVALEQRRMRASASGSRRRVARPPAREARATLRWVLRCGCGGRGDGFHAVGLMSTSRGPDGPPARRA